VTPWLCSEERSTRFGPGRRSGHRILWARSPLGMTIRVRCVWRSYSTRSAATGFVCAARRAGMQLAMMPATISNSFGGDTAESDSCGDHALGWMPTTLLPTLAR
jgi:hypothetical protein